MHRKLPQCIRLAYNRLVSDEMIMTLTGSRRGFFRNLLKIKWSLKILFKETMIPNIRNAFGCNKRRKLGTICLIKLQIGKFAFLGRVSKYVYVCCWTSAKVSHWTANYTTTFPGCVSICRRQLRISSPTTRNNAPLQANVAPSIVDGRTPVYTPLPSDAPFYRKGWVFHGKSGQSTAPCLLLTSSQMG